MEISVAKTRVMVVSKSACPPIVFMCNLQPIEQVQTFKYLGLHFHASGDISHLNGPLRAKAAGSGAVVQRRHSQLQCGNTVNLKLQLLQSTLTPSIHYECELWRVHSPTVALAKKSGTDLQRIYARHLWHICGVKFATPSAMLLAELGLLPLQVFWWQQTLQFYNKLATSPRDSLFHIILLDNQHDAFERGVKNFCSSIHRSLASIGHAMCHDSRVACVPAIVGLPQQHLQGVNAFGLHCPRAAPSVGVVSCTYHRCFRPYSKRRRYCQLPMSGRRMQRFLQFRLAHMGYPLSLAAFRVVNMSARASRVCLHCGGTSIADELHMVHERAALQPLWQQYGALFSPETDAMRSFFAQRDHMQVFNFILDFLKI